MNDKSYFEQDFATLPGPQYFSAANKNNIPDVEKSISIEKFNRKVLV